MTHPQPRVSSFTLTQRQQLPQSSLYAHHNNMKMADGMVNNQSAMRHNKKLSHQQKIYRYRYSNIRQAMDKYLDNVQQIYHHQPVYHNKSRQNIVKQHCHSFSENIPSLDNSMAMNYIQTVFKDYNIKNRFSNVGNSQKKLNSSSWLEITLSSERKNTRLHPSVEKDVSKKRRQFLSLTTNSSKVSSKTKPSVKESPRHRDQNALPFQQSPIIIKNPQNPSQQSNQRSQYHSKISQTFRYCINCQKLTLQANIDYHELYQCQQFKQIYKLNFHQLSQLLKQKITKIKHYLRFKLNDVRSKRDNIVRNHVELIDVMEKFVQVDEIQKENREEMYMKFQGSRQNGLNQSVLLTEKLRYFQKIYDKLRQAQKSNNSRESASNFIRNCSNEPIIPLQNRYNHLHSRRPHQSY